MGAHAASTATAAAAASKGAAAAGVGALACSAGATAAAPSSAPPRLLGAPAPAPAGRVICTGRPAPSFGTSTYIELCPLLRRLTLSTAPVRTGPRPPRAETVMPARGGPPAPPRVPHLLRAVPRVAAAPGLDVQSQADGPRVGPMVAGALGPRRGGPTLLDAVLRLLTRPRKPNNTRLALRARPLRRQGPALVPTKEATAAATSARARAGAAGAVAATA